MFIILMVFFVMVMFSGEGYYGHWRGYYGPRMAYSGIGFGWIVIVLGLLLLLPRWGTMSW